MKTIPLAIGGHAYDIVIGADILSTVDLSSIISGSDKTGFIVGILSRAGMNADSLSDIKDQNKKNPPS